MIDIFWATNKICMSSYEFTVYIQYFLLTSELRALWDKNRTFSLRGHLEENVALDFILERMNLEVYSMIDKDISPVRIQVSIRQLNSIRHVRGRALEAFE